MKYVKKSQGTNLVWIIKITFKISNPDNVEVKIINLKSLPWQVFWHDRVLGRVVIYSAQSEAWLVDLTKSAGGSEQLSRSHRVQKQRRHKEVFSQEEFSRKMATRHLELF